MAVTLKQGFGLVPNGVAISTANTNDTGDRALDAVTIGSGATLAADTSQLLHGKPMVKYQTGVSAAANGGWNSTSLNTALKTHYATFYIYIGAFGTNITCYRVTNAGTSNVIGSMILLTSRLLRWTNSASTTMVTTTIPIPFNTLTRVQAGILSDTTAGWAEISTFFTNPEGSVADETVRANNQATNSFAANTIRFGATNAAASNGPVWFGGFTASDTAYAGGVSAAPIAASGDMVSGSTFGGAGVRSTPITATLVSGSALASTAPDRATPVAADMVSGSSFGGATPPVIVPEAAVMTSGSAMAGTTPTLVEQAAATMVSGSVVTGSSARITPLASTAMASGSQLLGAGAVSGKPTGAFTSGSKLLNTAGMTLKIVSAGAMVSGSALDGGSPARIQGAIAGMLSGSVMTGGASLVIAPIATFTSRSAFGSASAATTSVTAVLLSGSLFGGSGLRTSPATAVLVSASTFSPSGALKTSAVGLMVSSTLFTGSGFVSSFSTMVSGSMLLTPIVESGLKVAVAGLLKDAVEADVIIGKQKHIARVSVISGGRKRPIIDYVTNLVRDRVVTTNTGSDISTSGLDTTLVRSGGPVYKTTAITGASYQLQHWNGNTGPMIPVTAGQVVRYSMYLKASAAGMSFRPNIRWRKPDMLELQPSTSSQVLGVAADTNWHRYDMVATVPVGAVYAHLSCLVTPTAAGQSAWSTDTMFTDGSALYDYGDGTYPGWQWKGTPFISESVGFPYKGLPELVIPRVGLTSWHDVFSTGLTDGASVDLWPDLSGNGWDLQQLTPNLQPVVDLTRQGVMFDGSGDYMDLVNPWNQPQPFTVYAIAWSTAKTNAAYQTLIDGTSGHSTVFFRDSTNPDLTSVFYEYNASSVSMPTAARLDVTAPTLISAVVNAAASSIETNGGNRGSGQNTGGAAQTPKLRIGATNTIQHYWRGGVRAVLFYNGSHSDQVRAQISRALMVKYGLAA